MTVTVLAGGLAVVALLGVSAFFSSAEIAVFSLSPEWLDGRAAAGDVRAGALAELRADPHRLLVTLLVGNNVVNIAISSIVTVLVAGYFSGGVAVTVATLVASSLVLVCGEILPKSYGLGNAERWALTAARPIAAVERLLSGRPRLRRSDAPSRGRNRRRPGHRRALRRGLTGAGGHTLREGVGLSAAVHFERTRRADRVFLPPVRN